MVRVIIISLLLTSCYTITASECNARHFFDEEARSQCMAFVQ